MIKTSRRNRLLAVNPNRPIEALEATPTLKPETTTKF
jgi:hypothetical protein